MNVTIQNIAGGSRHSFRKLTTLAKFVATRPVFGGYEIVGDRVDPDSDYDDVLAVVRYAESAARELKVRGQSTDWDKVVDLCISWFAKEAE